MITFHPFSAFPAVSAVEMLAEVYKPLFASGVFDRQVMMGEWSDMDELAAEIPSCFFVTEYLSEIAGFGSIDPRGKPAGVIGHHAVLPQFRGKGVGQAQLLEMESRLVSSGCSSVAAVTGAISFFAPARQLYLRSGYSIVSENSGKYFNTLRYEKRLGCSVT